VAGLFAVALVGFVIGGSDPQAIAGGYRMAMLVAAAGSAAAALIALLTVRPKRRSKTTT